MIHFFLKITPVIQIRRGRLSDEIVVPFIRDLNFYLHMFVCKEYSALLPKNLQLKTFIKPYLYISDSGEKGRGVYTEENIRSRTIIEVAPVIVLSAKERKLVEQTLLHDYIFEWGETRKKACVALGWVSIYNHSYTPNCEYEMDFAEKIMKIRTIRSIKKGEELTVNYNGEPDNDTPVWFLK